MRSACCRAMGVLLATMLMPAARTQTARISGFTADKSGWEHTYEALLKAIPD